MNRLIKESMKFNFFQAVSLLDDKFCSIELIDTDNFFFESDPSISFPSSDIRGIEENNGTFKFLLSFMGLTGVSSPLPIFFSDYILRHPEYSTALSDFLKLFNHRMYVFFYKAWKKYRFINNCISLSKESLLLHIARLSGIDPEKITKENVRILSYCGMLISSARSRTNLSALISGFFDGIPVEIEEFVPRWIDIGKNKTLGNSLILGHDCHIGSRIFDISGKFKIIIGPLKLEQFKEFLPKLRNISMIREIVDFYISDPLEYEIEVKLRNKELIPVILGNENTVLGQTSSLGLPSELTEYHSIKIS